MKISRRGLGLGTVALLGVAALGYRQFGGRWYAPTPYDDLLRQITDRAPAAELGKAAMKSMPHFETTALAARLRQPGFTLAGRTRGDAAAGRVMEADGWIVPETVALYSALAFQFS